MLTMLTFYVNIVNIKTRIYNKIGKNMYHHGNLKEEFIEIAFDFINKNDVEELTLKVLSNATGTSRSSIYRHFKNKDALMETIIEKGFDKFDKLTSPILLDNSKPLIDRFYLSTKIYMNFVQTNQNLYRLLFGKKYAHIRERIIDLKDKNCSGFGALKIAIEEGQKAGILKNDDSYQQAIIIWSSLHGLAMLLIDGFLDIEEIFDELIEKLFKGLIDSHLANKVKLLSTIPLLNKIIEPSK